MPHKEKRNFISLDEFFIEDEMLKEEPTDSEENSPFNYFRKIRLQEEIRNIIDTLKPRDKKIIELYFGVNNYNIHTLDEIAKLLHLSRERVRQLRNRSLRKMRENGDKLWYYL